MPELPEVETVRAGLARLLKNKPVIAALELSGRKLRRPIPAGLKRRLKGQRIMAVRRRGKYLLIDTPRLTLINHLGMTGTWRLGEPDDKHDHITLRLRDGRALIFRDPRRFGLFLDCPLKQEAKNSWLKNLGREPLEDFAGAYLHAAAKKRRTGIKALIMDQKVVVGVGNIYASEALHRAGIAPGRRCSRISKDRLDKLARAIQKILKEAIAAGGTTISDFRQAGGSEGYFSCRLRVYDRAGEACRACGELIRKMTHAGRSTYWCRRCQS
ncbi:MAG: bifunctional DNA-formamidopyrimidine glycosylase/DNA-(apurinic or apyrimidinic site) lyase [Elusimicrobiota bacterium]